MDVFSIIVMIFELLIILAALISMSRGLKKKDEKSLSAMVTAFSLIFGLAIVFSAIQGLDYFKIVEFKSIPTWSPFDVLSISAFLYLVSSVFTNFWTFKPIDKKKEN